MPVYRSEEAQLENRYAHETTVIKPKLLVLCEGQADCYFYRAITDAIQLETPSLPDVKFVDGGGKYALPKLIRETRRCREGLRVIVDFDVLSSETPLRDIVEALGGSWPVHHALWREVCHGVRTQRRAPGEVVANHNIRRLREHEYGVGRTRRQVKQVRPGSPPWVRAKRWGRRVVPADLNSSYEALAASLAGAGLFLVEVGELEGFVPGVGHHGSRWAGQVLKRYDAANASELEEARCFVRRVLGSRAEV